MSLQRVEYRSPLPVPAAEAFAWHERPGAFERLNAPFEPARVLARTGDGIRDGSTVTLAAGPLGMRWTVEHRDYVAGRQFRDVQRGGPFAHWDHLHRIVPDGPAASVLEDVVEYRLPLGALGALGGGRYVRGVLDRLFAYRHRLTAADLAMHAAARARGAAPMRIAVTGASGLIGSALVPALTTGGHQVLRVGRGPARDATSVRWSPDEGRLDPRDLEGVDAVVHLAGESVGAGRWTAARKAAIVGSRVRSTGLLAAALAKLDRRPRVLVSASAVGWYGDRGDQPLDESSGPGEGFLGELARAWEEAAEPARAAGIRVVHPRIGLVLTPAGGALAKLLTPFRLGLGGPLGSGRQWMSWIAIDDLVEVLHRALTDPALEGPLNAVSPQPVTNALFSATLGRVLGRPARLPAPAFALEALLGREMARAMLLGGQRVVPARLLAAGHRFRSPALEDALRHLLGRPR